MCVPATVATVQNCFQDQEEGFAMLVVKKNLRVSERFPYPVRVEAILELIDQFPVRKLEKMTRRVPHVRFLLPHSIFEA